MNRGRKALALSLALHGALFGGIYTGSSTFAHLGRPVVLDFTLADPAPPPAGGSMETKQPSRPVARQKMPTQVKPEVRKTERVEAPQKTSGIPTQPVTEQKGAAPVAETPRETSPGTAGKERVVPTVTGGSSGTVSTSRNATGVAGATGEGNSGEQARSRYTRDHYAYIKELIEKNLAYPPQARKMGWAGRVVVCFQVMKNGRVDRIRIKISSGHEILDRNVVETIQEVEPFPRPPEWAELSIPITYRLD